MEDKRCQLPRVLCKDCLAEEIESVMRLDPSRHLIEAAGNQRLAGNYGRALASGHGHGQPRHNAKIPGVAATC